jgi:hypothetical protein
MARCRFKREARGNVEMSFAVDYPLSEKSFSRYAT